MGAAQIQEILQPNEKTVAHLAYKIQLAAKAVIGFNWKGGFFILVTHIIAVYAFFVSPFHFRTILLNSVLGYFFLMGLTAGYHRLWSHKTYEASFIVKLVLCLLGGASFSMSIVNWVLDHRAHHKYTDTDKDPYNAKNGFWYCHLGWLMKARQRPNSDIRDLLADPLVRFQHKFYVPLAFGMGWGVPILVAGYGWGDWTGGFYVNIIRTVILHHCIFSINSWAHYGGDFIYADQQTARENALLAIFTHGEGYHNFHHEFPNDYRNGVNWHAYDPTKWVIATLEFFGLAWKLRRTPQDAIEKAKIATQLKILQAKKEQHFWGKPISSLPTYTRDQVEKEASKKKSSLVILDNIVYDVSDFLPLHPGGETILKAYVGKDITKEFKGGVYLHTNSAKIILDTLRVGKISGEM